MSEAKKAGKNSSLPVPYEDDGTDYWQSHLDSWVQSGLSQAAYCRRHDLDNGMPCSVFTYTGEGNHQWSLCSPNHGLALHGWGGDSVVVRKY